MTQERTIDSKTAIPMFEEGKKRYDALVQRHTRLSVELDSARKQYMEGSREAEIEFGTSDINQMREMHRTREAKKLKDILEFVIAVDEVEAELNDIEQKAA